MGTSLEFWSVAFSALTFIVIAVTAIAALVQLRHLRAANQLNALVTVMQDWQSPRMQEWVRFVRTELQARLEDPNYLLSLEDPGWRRDREKHPWLHLADYYEQLGSYIKYRLVDRNSYLEVNCLGVSDLYRRMEPCIEKVREVAGTKAIFDNFEFLAVLGLQWIRLHPEGTYPRNLPRFKDVPKDS